MRLIDADKIEPHEQLEPLGNGKYEYVRVAYMDDIDALPPVDAIPIDWINLFNSTPIGGDSIDDLLLEWRYKQEVEAEQEREDGERQ